MRDLPPRPVTVLVAGDDDREDTKQLLRELTSAGYELRWVASAEEAARAPYAIVSARALGELAELRHDAFHDALTGLPNRALFPDRLELSLKRARAPRRRVLLRRPVLRPRPLQGRQRLARPRRRRPAADGRRPAHRGLRCARATRSRASAATSSRCCSTTSATCAAPRSSPSACRRRSPRRSRSTSRELVRVGEHRHRARRAGHARPRTSLRDADVAMYRAKAQGRRAPRGLRRGDARARDGAAPARDRTCAARSSAGSCACSTSP